MWVRYLKSLPGIEKGSVAWAENDEEAQQSIDEGFLVRCTGPDGVALGEAAPEEVITQLAREDNMTFAQKEQQIQEGKANI